MMTLPHGSRCRDKNPTRINSSVVLAYTAGITFTLASAGTNLTYALSKADTLPQQLIWGSVAVAASIALALAPSAVMASLQARRTGAAILAIIAMLVFGVYSVTSALGSATGVRPVGSVEASDVAAKRKQAQAAIATAQTELATIGTIRPSATIQAEIDGKLATRRDLDDCAAKWLSSSVARSVCIEVHALRAEKAKSDRKTELEAQVTEARATLAELKASTPSDVASRGLSSCNLLLGCTPRHGRNCPISTDRYGAANRRLMKGTAVVAAAIDVIDPNSTNAIAYDMAWHNPLPMNKYLRATLHITEA